MIQEELAKMAPGSQSNSIIIVNIHIGDLVQQVHELSERGLSAQNVIAASRSHTLPALLSTTNVQQKTAYALKGFDTLLRWSDEELTAFSSLIFAYRLAKEIKPVFDLRDNGFLR